MNDRALQLCAAEEHLGGDDLRGQGRTACMVFEHVRTRAGDYLPDEAGGFGPEVIEVFFVEDPVHTGQTDRPAHRRGTDSRREPGRERKSNQPSHRGEYSQPRHPYSLAP